MQFLKSITVLFLGLIVLSCNKDDNKTSEAPKKPYAEQAPIDDLAINKFLDEYNMYVSPDFEDVKFERIKNNNLPSIRSQYQVRDTLIKFDDFNHKMYYIKFAEGNGERASKVDSVFVNYKGEYIYTKKDAAAIDPLDKEYIANFKFEESLVTSWRNQTNYIRGWEELMALLKTGDSSVGSNGGVVFQNFGAGVVFMPSALGYYNRGTGSIPQYSPLIFNISLKKINRIDHDRDGVDSVLEEFVFDQSKKVYVAQEKDTDGDKTLDMYDNDDDGDFYYTKNEIANSLKYDKDRDGDSDNDGKPDYLDNDDDNDGMLTKDEKSGYNKYGIPYYLDPEIKIHK